jgi:hypothetical protein
VPEEGFEPPRPFGLPGLSRLRLPFRHSGIDQILHTCVEIVCPLKSTGRWLGRSWSAARFLREQA